MKQLNTQINIEQSKRIQLLEAAMSTRQKTFSSIATHPDFTRPPAAQDRARGSTNGKASKWLVASAVAALVFFPTAKSAFAAQLSLAQTPLYLISPVKNHITLIVDDSGSMDGEVLFPTNDGAVWWHTGDRRFNGRDSSDTDQGSASSIVNYNNVGTANGTWQKYVYLFPNGSGGANQGERVYADAADDHYAVPPLPQYAWTRSPIYNKIYFNPDVTYVPWVDSDSASLGNSSPTAARTDPIYPTGSPTNWPAVVNLTADQDRCGSNETFRFQTGMVIPSTGVYWSTCAGAFAQGARTVTTEESLGVRYFPATFYLPSGTSPSASFGFTGTPTTNGRGPDGATVLNGYEIKPGNFAVAADYTRAIQNFANWFTYYRKRHLATRAGMGHALDGQRNIRMAVFRINSSPTLTSYDFDTTASRSSFYTSLYNIATTGQGTPNRQALHHAGQQYRRTDANAPIQQACQQNFAMLFTDGFTTPDTSSGVNNADGSSGAPYADSYSNTIADIAMYHYDTNLRPDLQAGQVPTSTLDSNSDPHMVTFGIGLGGLTGNIYGKTIGSTTYLTRADAIASPPTWVNPTTARNPVQVDDLYHAAVNGRGEMLNSATAASIKDTVQTTLDKIREYDSGASAVSVTSGIVGGGNKAYQAQFKSGTWIGDVIINDVNSDGSVTPTVGAPNAATRLGTQPWDTGANGRQILTYFSNTAPTGCSSGTGTEGGVAFRWASISGPQQCALDFKPSTVVSDGFGQQRLNYIRGERTNEGTGVDQFRRRTQVLGDLINSEPVYVGAPTAVGAAEAISHATYQASQALRTPMVYVGGNDGMLHGFDANTMYEKVAYVPSMVYSKLNELPNRLYTHRYYVDGSPTVGDAFGRFGKSGQPCNGTECWRTVLVGGLGAGGKGFFALDVSDPDGTAGGTGAAATTQLAFSEGNAANIVLWEFPEVRGGTADPDLGYSFGKATIMRVRDDETGSGNTTWAAIFSNGYNSTNERAFLYIVNIANGQLIRKIMLPDPALDPSADASIAPATLYGNGLSTPRVIDDGGDFTADYVFAGDLVGNMWKIDLTSSDRNDWDSFYKTGGGTPVPLYSARDGATRLPITEMPAYMPHPLGLSGYLVFFGTGRYIDSSDSAPQASPINAFQAIWDRNVTGSTVSGNAAVQASRLLPQTLSQSSSGGVITRTLSTNNAIGVWGDTGTACNTSGVPDNTCMGWRVNLLTGAALSLGEMSVTDPVVVPLPGQTATTQDSNVIFTTLVPSDQPCDWGGSGFLMEFGVLNGGIPSTVIDVDQNGTSDSTEVGIVGVNRNQGALSRVVIVRDPNTGTIYKETTQAKGGRVGTERNNPPPPPPPPPGSYRKSWRQIQ